MKRAKKVFRGAVVEGFGALIFLMIVAVSLPNLLNSPEETGQQPVGESAQPAILRQVPEHEQPETGPVRDWLTSLRQAVYEEPVENQTTTSAQTNANRNVAVPSYHTVVSQQQGVNRHAVYWQVD